MLWWEGLYLNKQHTTYTWGGGVLKLAGKSVFIEIKLIDEAHFTSIHCDQKSLSDEHIFWFVVSVSEEMCNFLWFLHVAVI